MAIVPVQLTSLTLRREPHGRLLLNLGCSCVRLVACCVLFGRTYHHPLAAAGVSRLLECATVTGLVHRQVVVGLENPPDRPRLALDDLVVDTNSREASSEGRQENQHGDLPGGVPEAIRLEVAISQAGDD